MADDDDDLIDTAEQLVALSYEPWDQDEKITDWEALKDPVAREMQPGRAVVRAEQIEAWEAAHGHDVRLKCYAEFGCQLLEVPWAKLVLKQREQIARLRRGESV